MQLACGSGLELIYEFLTTDEDTHRPHINPRPLKVQLPVKHSRTYLLLTCDMTLSPEKQAALLCIGKNSACFRCSCNVLQRE